MSKKSKSNIGAGLRGLVVIFVFMVAFGSYFGCLDEVQAGEAKAKAEKPKKKGVEELIAEKKAEIDRLTKEGKVEQDKAFVTYEHQATLIKKAAEVDKDEIDVALRRTDSMLQHTRVKWLDRPFQSRKDREQHAKETAIARKKFKELFYDAHRWRRDEQLRKNQDDYRDQENEVIGPYNKKIAEHQKAVKKLEGSWAFKWVRVKRWTGTKYDNTLAWFRGDKKDKEAVATK